MIDADEARRGGTRCGGATVKTRRAEREGEKEEEGEEAEEAGVSERKARIRRSLFGAGRTDGPTAGRR